MPFPRRKVYRDGSPGSRRAAVGITLNAIKTAIRKSSDRTKSRRQYISDGLLGGRGRRPPRIAGIRRMG
jgi:hypothetical protein